MSGVSWHERGFRETGAPRNPISRARLERVASRVIAGFGLIFGAQTITTLLAQLPGMAMPGGMIAAVALFGGLVLVLITAIVQYGVKLAMAYFAIAYLVVVEVWPLIAVDPTYPLGSKPWVWYLCTVATAFAAVAFPLVWAAVYTVAAPTAYAVIRALPSGGGVGPGPAALDAAYAVILGGTILVIVAMLRQAASGVDRAQSAALDTYSNAVREHAMEVERVQVDAIVHDSVLTTLLSAASAETQDECLLAASMAEDAIGHLRAAEAVDPDDQTLIDLDRLARRVEAGAVAFSPGFRVSVSGVDGQTLPAHVAEALYSATMQAMVNSVQHAGGPDVARSLSIVGGELAPIVTVTVSDAGRGFDPGSVPSERLGLRVSIADRIAKVGGEATVTSAPGRGASIRLVWPVLREVSVQ